MSRKKKDDDENIIPTAVVVVGDNSAHYSPPTLHSKQTDGYITNNMTQYSSQMYQQVPSNDVQMTDWNIWNTQDFDDKSKSDLQTGVHDDGGEENAEVDFFKDMEPEVKVKKVFVKKKSRNSSISNRLSVDQDLDFAARGELDEWVDDDVDKGGWEDDIVPDVDEAKVLREAQEHRRLERQHRTKQQRADKMAPKNQKLAQRVT